MVANRFRKPADLLAAGQRSTRLPSSTRREPTAEADELFSTIHRNKERFSVQKVSEAFSTRSTIMTEFTVKYPSKDHPEILLEISFPLHRVGTTDIVCVHFTVEFLEDVAAILRDHGLQVTIS